MTPEELARTVLESANQLLSALPRLTDQGRSTVVSQIERLSKLIDDNVVAANDPRWDDLWSRTITPVNGVRATLGPLASSIEKGSAASRAFAEAVDDLRSEIDKTQAVEKTEPRGGHD